MYNPIIVRPAVSPRMRVVTVTPPVAEPITLADAKLYLRVTNSLEDSLISSLISVARQLVERETRRAIGTQSLRQVMSWFPPGGVVELARPPVQSVTSITYYDSANVLRTLPTTVYALGTGAGSGVPPIVSLLPGQVFPQTADREEGLFIDFVAGHDTGDPLPAPLLHAMRLALGYLYERRGQETGADGGFGMAFQALCEGYTVQAV